LSLGPFCPALGHRETEAKSSAAQDPIVAIKRSHVAAAAKGDVLDGRVKRALRVQALPTHAKLIEE
jgi:hypothetical protein